MKIELKSEHIGRLTLEACKIESEMDSVNFGTCYLYAIEGIFSYLEGLEALLSEVDKACVRDFVHETVV